MSNTLTQGGYGDGTTGVYALSSSAPEKQYWGKFGTSTSTTSNIDINTDLSATRYLMITYYAVSGSMTAAMGAGSVEVGTFDSTMTAYMTAPTEPTAVTSCFTTGANLFQAGLALSALIGMIY